MGKYWLYLLFFTLSCGLFGQSQTETANYILREIRACENDHFEVKEARFIDGDSVFQITTSTPGQAVERSLEIALADVDIYSKRAVVKAGNDGYSYTYSLIVTTRGRAAGIKKNMSRVTGSEYLLWDRLDGRQVKSLEMAFARLTELTTGRRPLFTPSMDLP